MKVIHRRTARPCGPSAGTAPCRPRARQVAERPGRLRRAVRKGEGPAIGVHGPRPIARRLPGAAHQVPIPAAVAKQRRAPRQQRQRVLRAPQLERRVRRNPITASWLTKSASSARWNAERDSGIRPSRAPEPPQRGPGLRQRRIQTRRGEQRPFRVPPAPLLPVGVREEEPGPDVCRLASRLGLPEADMVPKVPVSRPGCDRSAAAMAAASTAPAVRRRRRSSQPSQRDGRPARPPPDRSPPTAGTRSAPPSGTGATTMKLPVSRNAAPYQASPRQRPPAVASRTRRGPRGPPRQQHRDPPEIADARHRPQHPVHVHGVQPQREDELAEVEQLHLQRRGEAPGEREVHEGVVQGADGACRGSPAEGSAHRRSASQASGERRRLRVEPPAAPRAGRADRAPRRRPRSSSSSGKTTALSFDSSAAT